MTSILFVISFADGTTIFATLSRTTLRRKLIGIEISFKSGGAKQHNKEISTLQLMSRVLIGIKLEIGSKEIEKTKEKNENIMKGATVGKLG